MRRRVVAHRELDPHQRADVRAERRMREQPGDHRQFQWLPRQPDAHIHRQHLGVLRFVREQDRTVETSRQQDECGAARRIGTGAHDKCLMQHTLGDDPCVLG
jgi:hypothetical protein